MRDEASAIVTVCSHLGRPDGKEDKFSLAPCAERMSELLGQDVTLAPDCIGEEVAKIVDAAKEGDVIMLENTRYYKEETKNEAGFVEKLAAPFDLYVNDAFGTAHRAHASTEGVTKFLQPSVSGFLLAKELEYLDGAVSNGEKPMAAIVGGSKVSSKITVLEALVDKCDKIIIGGGMVFTFLKAKGLEVGTSLVEDDFVETAKEVMAKADDLGRDEKGIRIQTRKSMGQTVYRHLQSCLIVLAFHLFVFAITQNYCVPSCACVCFEHADRPLERPCKADQFFTSKCSLKPFNYTSL